MKLSNIVFFMILCSLQACEKNVDDNIAGHTWQYEATYTANTGESEVINAKGQFVFNDDHTGKQTESEIHHWDFQWSTSSDYVYIEYDSSGYLNYTIKVNEEKKQEWTAQAYYVFDDGSAIPTTITMKLTR